MMDDPWNWDIDRVVKEFCTNDRTWRPITEPARLPEPGSFELTLRSHEVEGFALLDTEPEAFCDYVGINPLTQRRTLIHAVQQLRKRSRGYKEEQRKKNADAEDELPGEHAGSSQTRKREPDEDDRADSKRRLRMILDRDPSPETTIVGPVPTTVPVAVADHKTDAVPAAPPVTSPKKTRRIAPQMISTDIDPQNINRNIPTAADVVTGFRPVPKVSPIKTKAQPYLGTDGISRIDFIDGTYSLPGHKITGTDDSWALVRTQAMPVGRQRQAYRVMRRRMHPNRLLGARRGRRRPDMAEGLGDPELNEVLPPYGESDDEDGYDTETWEEMEKEAQETHPALTRLSSDEVAATLDDLIQSHRDVWLERKLPRLMHNAHRIWQRTRGLHLRKCVKVANQRVAHLEHRLSRIKQQILGQEWRSKADLESMSGNLQATVTDVEAARWELRVIRSSSAPAKLPRQVRTGHKIRENTRLLDADDEEILSSEDDEEENEQGFIEDEEEFINLDVNMDDVPLPDLQMDVDEQLLEELEQARGPGSEPEPEPESEPSDQLPDEAVAAENQPPPEDDAMTDADPAIGGPPVASMEVHEDALAEVDNVLNPDAATVEDSVVSPTPLVEDDPVLFDDGDLTILPESRDTAKCPLADALPQEHARGGPRTPSRPQPHEIIDLTSSPPPEDDVPKPAPPSTPVVVDSTLDPIRQNSRPKIKQEATPSSSIASSRKRRRSNGTRIRQSYLEMGIDDLNETRTKVATAIARLDDMKINSIFTLADVLGASLWATFVKPIYTEDDYPEDSVDDHADAVKVAYRFVRFFDIWNEQTPVSWGSMTKADEATRRAHLSTIDQRNSQSCVAFSNFLISISDRFSWTEVESLKEKYRSKELDEADASAESDIEQEYGSGADQEEDLAPQSTPQKKARATAVDKVGRDLRKSAHALGAERAAKVKAFRAKMAAFGADTGSSFIINESKEDDESIIHVHQEIARFIKMHQVEGVRFMWNLITQRSGTRQGCLLAHSMGLGKTLQVITLLVTLAACSTSEDDSIRSQIPEELRGGRFLILCPPSLINNWYEEILCWTPDDHALGEIWKLDAESVPSERERRRVIEDWNNSGGVLLLPYSLFRSLVGKESIKAMLLERPNLVVADEAHLMKNPKSQLHIAAANFSTQLRIAMTGSPLANNVEEYHAMINWIAPGFLSDLKRFRDDFARPIQEGLEVTSTYGQRRRMLARLVTLKKAVAPRVDRKTLAVLKSSMQKKTEFVISMPLTDLQRKAYDLFINNQRDIVLDTAVSSNATIFHTLNILALLCAHPACFQRRLSDKPAGPKVEQSSRETTVSSEDVTDDSLTGAKLKPTLVEEELKLLKGMSNPRQHSGPLSWKTEIFMAIVRESVKLKESVLVFSQSLYALDHLQHTLNMARIGNVRLDGKTQMSIRQEMVKKFNQTPGKIFLISTTAGGLGLNITGANRVIIFDFKFNPQAEQQAIGRSYRIGQTKEVFVYRLICGGTFEDKMLNRVVFKMQLAQRVVDKKNPIPKARQFAEFLDPPTDPPAKDVEQYRGIDPVLDAILASADTRPGIRSVTTMDTFEEEEVGENDVTPEERAEAEQLLNMHKGVPHPVVNLAQPPQRAPVPSSLPMPVASDTNGRNSHGLTAAMVPGVVAPQPATMIPPPSVAELPGAQEPIVPQSATTGHNNIAGPTEPLAPIAGASTSTRQPGSADFLLANHRVFRGELKRAFNHRPGSAPLDPTSSQKRTQTAYKIADLLASADENGTAFNSTQALKNAILEAASGTGRFVEAICAGLVSPEALVSMDPAGVQRSSVQWDKMPDAVWVTVLKQPTTSRTDPEV